MSKFKKLVELVKNRAEKYIVYDNEYSGVVFLPTKTEDFIFVLGGDWYYQMLTQAGYAESTAECGRQGFSQGNVASCCNGKRKTHKGYEWKYL